MPSSADVVCVFLFLVAGSIGEYVLVYPRLHADVAHERPGARAWAYRWIVLELWAFTIAAIAIWVTHHRSWPTLGLVLRPGWPLALGGISVLAGAAFSLLQMWSVIRLSIAQRIRARPRLAAVEFFLPHTRQEVIWFYVLAITAGFCEEFLYRGYLVWFFAAWLGSAGAMITAVLIFGASHAYLGRQGAITAIIEGVLFTIIVLVTHSLIPAMIVHALIDISGGTFGYSMLRNYESTGPASRVIAGSAKELV